MFFPQVIVFREIVVVIKLNVFGEFSSFLHCSWPVASKAASG